MKLTFYHMRCFELFEDAFNKKSSKFGSDFRLLKTSNTNRELFPS